MFIQGFRAGEARPMPAAAFHEVLGPHLTDHEPEHGFWRLRAPDGGEADVYAVVEEEALEGIMLDDIGVGGVLDLALRFARRADAVILPAGCPALLVDEQQASELPDELRADTRVVTRGSDIEAAVRDQTWP